METAWRQLIRVAEDTLSYEYQMGGVTQVLPHSTGWRQLPALMLAFLDGYDVTMERRDAAPLRIRRGHAVCVPPGLDHCITQTSRSAALSRWSHMNFRVLDSLDVFAILAPPLSVAGATATRLGELNTELAELSRHPEPGLAEAFRRKALALELMARIAEVSTIRPHGLALLQNARGLAPVLGHIQVNLAGDLGRDALARVAGLSPSRFHCVFEKAMGCAPGQYVQEVRVRRAQQWLLGTRLSVKEIGLRVGYDDPFNFSRMFKKACGVSPVKYREQVSRLP